MGAGPPHLPSGFRWVRLEASDASGHGWYSTAWEDETMRRTALGLLFALGMGTGGWATELTPEQEQLVDELTHQLMAPC